MLRDTDIPLAARLTIQELNKIAPTNPIKGNRRHVGVTLDVSVKNQFFPRFHSGFGQNILEIVGSDQEPKVTKFIFVSEDNTHGLTSEAAVRLVLAYVDPTLLPSVVTIQRSPYLYSGYTPASREFFDILH